MKSISEIKQEMDEVYSKLDDIAARGDISIDISKTPEWKRYVQLRKMLKERTTLRT